MSTSSSAMARASPGGPLRTFAWYLLVPFDAQEFSIDRRDGLDRLPPGAVPGDLAFDKRHQLRRNGDLLGAAAGKCDAEIGGVVRLALGTAASWLAAAQRADNNASTQNIREWRQTLRSPATTIQKALHVLHFYNRKTCAESTRQSLALYEPGPI